VIKTALGVALAPLCGFLIAVVLVIAVTWLAAPHRPFAVDRNFRQLQLLSAALYSLRHGGNDAQKTMGVIAILPYSGGYLTGGFHAPLWVVLSCQTAMALGTLSGGWRIVRTMESRITHLTPMQGWWRKRAARRHCLPPLARCSGVDDAHDYRRHYRGWFGAPPFCGTLGCGRRYRHRLDCDHACRRSRAALFYGVSLVWCVPCGFCGGMLPTEPALDAIWLKGDPAGSGRL
jgi:Phosphate transporter family